MTIRKLSSSRWQDYKTLRLEAVENNPQSFLSTKQETLDEPDKEWQEKIANMWFAIDDQDHLVGMIGCYRETKEKLRHTAHIVSFYVQTQSRGQGIGRALLQTALDEAQKMHGVKKVILGVITTQDRAYHLYQSFGFETVGQVKMSVQVNQTFYDEYLMEKYF